MVNTGPLMRKNVNNDVTEIDLLFYCIAFLLCSESCLIRPRAHIIGLWCTLKKYTGVDHTSRSLPSYSLIFSCSICSLLADSLSGFWAQKWPAFNTWNEMETTACVINILLVNVNKHWNKSLYETKQTQGVEEAAWEHDRLVRARDLKSRDCGFESRSDHLAGVVSR